MDAVVRAGEILKGKYRIDRVLGEGGMGIVFAAHHLALDQRVAIKVLRPAMLDDAEIVERFTREARAASRIESDHVARVLDVDATDGGAPFIVMEYLEGRDLSTVRASGVGLPVAAAVRCVIEACEAIGEAHRLGIVHRDLKPANLFLATRADGLTRLKVLDFGISKIGDGGASPSVTTSQAVMGSAEYMSPEQMRSVRDVDARTDIWSLGVTLYELLTARLPFPGKAISQVCALVLSTEPEPPSALQPEVPRGLDEVVRRCLEKDRERRYGSIAELTAALAPYAGVEPAKEQSSLGALVGAALSQHVSSTARTVPVHDSAPLATGTAGGLTLPALPKTSMRSVGIGAAIAVLVIGTLVIHSWSRAPGGSQSSASAVPASSPPAVPAQAASSPPPAALAPSASAPAALPGAAPSGPAMPAGSPPRPTAAQKPAPAARPAPKPPAAPPPAAADTHTLD